MHGWENRVPSGYTPLHQAAYHGAPVDIVEILIKHGAWSLCPLHVLRVGGINNAFQEPSEHLEAKTSRH